jgi:hypothetical protein
LLFSVCFGDEKQDQGRLGFNNFSEKCIVCSVFYSIASEAFLRSNLIQDSKVADQNRENSILMAYETASIGRTPEMASNVTTARMELTMQEMLKEINNNIENISILILKYGENCKRLLKDPESVLSETMIETVSRNKNKD